MVRGRVKCHCRIDTPEVIDEHNLTPDGNTPTVVAGRDCVLCGNTRWTTSGRIRAGFLGGALFVVGCLAGFVALALLLVALSGVLSYQLPVGLAAGSLTSLFAALLIEKALAKSAPRPPGAG